MHVRTSVRKVHAREQIPRHIRLKNRGMLGNLITKLDTLVDNNRYKSNSKKHYSCIVFTWFHVLRVAVVVNRNVSGKGTISRYATLLKKIV